MGLSASQARLLLLTARKSDIEYRVQQINNRRMQITYQLEAIAKQYSDGIADRKLIINKSDTTEELSLQSIQSTYGGAVKAFNRAGGLVDNSVDASSLQEGLRNNTYYLALVDQNGKPVLDENNNSTFNWRTNTQISDVLNESNDEEIMANYEYQTSQIQGQDKRLELEMKNLDTQHKEVETEVDAVKKVIDKNIESSFKTFG
jgi:hypothetical protein